MKVFLKYVLLYIIITVLMLGLLLIVSFIPKETISENVKKSAILLNDQGEKVFFNSFGSKLFDDNSTDAIMLNLTYTIDEDNKLESIIRARRNFVPGVTKEIVPDVVGDLPYEAGYFSMTEEFLKTIQGKEQIAFEYGRYWHGYIVILRLLLCFVDIAGIRIITQLTILVLLAILMYYLGKNNSWKFSIAIFLSFVATDLFTWIYTIQGRFVAIIALLISVFVANKKINNKNLNVWLFISGALTAYFDFLTTPLLSLLLPIVVYTAINNDKTTFRQEIAKILKNFVAWGFGYVGLWATKWIIADLLFDTNIIKISLIQIYYRIFGINNSKVIKIKNIESLKINVKISINYLVIIIYELTLVWAIIKKVYFRKKGMFLSTNKIPYYICIIVTLMWYFIVAEHSHKHFFFTYKTMVIPLIATTFIVFDNKEKKKPIEEKDVKND